HVRRVSYPDRASDVFEYGSDARPSTLRDRNGSAWTRDESGWAHRGADGSALEHLDGEITVSNEGVISILTRDGVGEKRWPDGSGTEFHADGSTAWRDSDGHPLAAVGADAPAESSTEP